MTRSHDVHRDGGSPSRLLSIPQAAEYLGVSVRTFFKLRRELVEVRYPHSRMVRFDRHDLDRWIESRKVPA